MAKTPLTHKETIQGVLEVHPFFDYNGRVSRLLGEIILLKNNLQIVSFQATHRTDFVKAVKEATKTDNLSLLKQLISENSRNKL